MKQPFSRRGFFAVVAAASIFSFNTFAGPSEMGLDHASVRSAILRQNQVTSGLMRNPGVLGTAITDAGNGRATVIVFIDRNNPAAVAMPLPAGTQAELTDKFIAMGKPTGGSTSTPHKGAQAAPIQLGTSGGWSLDIANGYCCGGTLGSLFQVNGVQYILSNYHVFESDIVIGGNGYVATDGTSIIQPGLVDSNCSSANSLGVATLVTVHSLPNSNVDVGVGQVVAGQVRTDGSILEIGPISAQTVAPKLNQAVKKSGRTTGLTHSKITGLNATINVTYENECAGGTAFTKQFTGQIVVSNKGSSFLKSGDSGSLMVEDVATKPRAVGLLYAGSSTSAIANPIGDVLTFLSGALGGTATMVGQ